MGSSLGCRWWRRLGYLASGMEERWREVDAELDLGPWMIGAAVHAAPLERLRKGSPSPNSTGVDISERPAQHLFFES